MTTIDPTIGGIVLCGGQGRRMGADKAWLKFGDELLLQRMVRIVGEVVDHVVVAGRPGQALPELPDDVAVVCDAVDHTGPLAGIAAGLERLDGHCDAAFVAACDYPLIHAELIRRLIDRLGDHQAVVVADQERMHPLLGVYRMTTRTVLADLLDQGDLRAGHFAKECHACDINEDDLADIDPGLRALQNVNDQAAYEQALRDASQGT